MTEYLRYERDARAEEGRKTQVWRVLQASNGSRLGTIKWFAQWRQYCFWPEPAIFNPGCLESIAGKCQGLTRAHRERQS